MTSPWPDIEKAAQRRLAPVGETFTYEQCTGCRRWFPSRRALAEAAPTLCPWTCAGPTDKQRAARERMRRIGKGSRR